MDLKSMKNGEIKNAATRSAIDNTRDWVNRNCISFSSAFWITLPQYSRPSVSSGPLLNLSVSFVPHFWSLIPPAKTKQSVLGEWESFGIFRLSAWTATTRIQKATAVVLWLDYRPFLPSERSRSISQKLEMPYYPGMKPKSPMSLDIGFPAVLFKSSDSFR